MYSGSLEPKWALRGVLCALKKTLKQLVLGTNPSTYVYVCEWPMRWHMRNTSQYTFTTKSNICQQDVGLFYNYFTITVGFCVFSFRFCGCSGVLLRICRGGLEGERAAEQACGPGDIDKNKYKYIE